MDNFAIPRQDSFDVGRAPMPAASFPPKGSALVDSYRQDALNGFERENPPMNPINQDRVQSSVFVNLKDSVQVHLLTETALFDSKEYVILSEDEVDNLKKQCQFLIQRIEQARSNLTIQSKYRDATVSMTRLYSPTGRRRSLLGNRLSEGSDAAREAEAERDAIQKKCEDLAAELWSLEQRLMEPQRKLLEHTAGILQHAHKMAKKKGDCIFKTTFNFLEDGLVFDEASLYRSFDTTEMLNTQSLQNPIEIPLKSPVREQNKQLAEESDKLRQENDQLRSETEALLAEIEALRRQGSNQWDMISDTERRLEKFNHQLREVVIKTDPTRNRDYDPVPTGQRDPGDMLNSHIDYLENAFFLVYDHYSNRPEVGPKLQSLNSQIQDILISVDPSHPQAPPLAENVEKQFEYLQESLQAVDEQFRRTADMAYSTSTNKQKSEQSEAVLMGLWDIIQSGYADIRQRKQERRKARMEKGLEPDEEDLSDSDSADANESYSLAAFSSKVQWLYTQATRLNEQKAVLKRQIKQQRELNSKSDSEKDQQLHDKESELEETNTRLNRAERETNDARIQLSQVLEELENLQNSRNQEAAAIGESQEQLKQRTVRIASLESEAKDMQARLVTAEATIDSITTQLKDANDARDVAQRAVEERETIIKTKEQELEQMTGMVAELKMETAMTKAELDGAYGSRKERAAEVAALHNTSESAKIKLRVESLEQELEATANDLTDVVKQSLESEKKIGELEDELDKVKAERDRIRDQQEKVNEDLERQLHDATSDLEERMEAEVARLRKEKEQVQDELDRERLKGGSGTGSSGVSKTSYLTDSYRVGLRAERKKYEEQLRAEQMLRRKVEDELRALKRAQGPGKTTKTDKSHIEGPVHLNRYTTENQDVSRDSLPAKNMATEEHRISRPGASFDDLPFELVDEALSYLNDYKDLIKLQTQITFNIIEPEALQMALVAFYCVAGGESIPYISLRNSATKRKRELPDCPPFQFPFQLPFPTQQSEIARFFYLCKSIKSVAERLVSKSRAFNALVPTKYKVLSSDSVDCLTPEERGRLEKQLFQYELLATALNHEPHRAYNNRRRRDLGLFKSSSHRWLADFLLGGMGSREFQQFLAVESSILDDYWFWEEQFQTSFIDEIIEATEKAKASSLDASGDSSQKANYNMKFYMINIKQALAVEDVGNPVDRLDYIHEGHYQYTRAYEWDCFLATLQTFGLKWYEEMWRAPPARRNQLLLHAHKMHGNIRRLSDVERNSTLRNSNIKGWGTSSRYYAPEIERIRTPEKHIGKYLKKVADRFREIKQSLRSGDWPFRTTRWPWDEAHLVMNFKRHCVFDRMASDRRPHNSYCDLAGAFVAKRETNPPTAIDLVSDRDELPISVWMDIMDKYQMNGTRWIDVI
ncbi:hypothetical protein GQX73_g4146 [Xylaria multiplex]|uniref:Uncharacterized protein n=1 Tax=Xylaria multiplex TaxID=323545 RepID=A0A7C8IQ28_9PEZI|nr:hypothetical protein GQX73_g4146 [Xylaria multiplex]